MQGIIPYYLFVIICQFERNSSGISLLQLSASSFFEKIHSVKEKFQITKIFMKSLTNENIQLGFTPCKTEQPLQGMELQQKETQKDSSSQVKGKHFIGKEFQSLAVESIRIMIRPPSRIRKWNQLSQFRWTSTKVILIEKI